MRSYVWGPCTGRSVVGRAGGSGSLYGEIQCIMGNGHMPFWTEWLTATDRHDWKTSSSRNFVGGLWQSRNLTCNNYIRIWYACSTTSNVILKMEQSVIYFIHTIQVKFLKILVSFATRWTVYTVLQILYHFSDCCACKVVLCIKSQKTPPYKKHFAPVKQQLHSFRDTVLTSWSVYLWSSDSLAISHNTSDLSSDPDIMRTLSLRKCVTQTGLEP